MKKNCHERLLSNKSAYNYDICFKDVNSTILNHSGGEKVKKWHKTA